MPKTRDLTIDLARGIAIILMVAANMSMLVPDDQPMWIFRLISSLAAPMFITLAGTMVTLSVIRGASFFHFIKYSVFLLIIAGLLDVLIGGIPYLNYDVLYLIGLSLPIAALATHLRYGQLIFLTITIIFFTPILQYLFGYDIGIHFEIPANTSYLTYLQMALHRALIDGWFPIFPWLSVVLAGVLLGKLRYTSFPEIQNFQQRKYIIAVTVLCFVGCLLWNIAPGAQEIRFGFIEFFYPPVPGFMIFSTGMVLGLFIILERIPHITAWQYVRPLGETSLFMYVFHTLFIKYIFVFFSPMTFGLKYFVLYLILIISMIGIGLFIRKIKIRPSYASMPYVIKRLLGS